MLRLSVSSAGSQLKESPWFDTQLAPFYAVLVSIAVLRVQALVRSNPAVLSLHTRLWGKAESAAAPILQVVPTESQRVPSPVILRWKAVKIVAILALVSIQSFHIPWALRHPTRIVDWAAALPVASFYASMLSAVSFSPINRQAESHLAFILLVIFGTFAYRDIWPLMTFTLVPVDEAEGRVLWIKVALAGFAGVVEPLFEPYSYVPVNPTDSFHEPNLEQTASIMSFVFFSFMDPTVSKAHRVSHLSVDNLPLQCDYDYVTHLIADAYPALDPFSGAGRHRSLLWGFLWIFRSSLFYQTLLILLTAVTKLAGPIGQYQLLSYLETGGEDAVVRPWVWIMLLTLGPLVNDIITQVVSYMIAVCMVQLEAILTSLIFDHALRIRLKAEVPDDASAGERGRTPSDALELETVLSNNSEADRTEVDENADDNKPSDPERDASVSAASTSTLTAPVVFVSKGGGEESRKSEGAKGTTQTDKLKDKRSSLTGRLNNLVTSDQENIVGNADFLFVVLQIPLQAMAGIWFLYAILGWSSLVGLAVMVLLFPVPTALSKMMRGAQKAKMEATDARVQEVTEVMNVLRMIKIFGWGSRVESNISEKREKELQMVWKLKLLQMGLNIVNFVIPLAHMIITYVVYTTIMKRTLTASVVFSSMTGFNILRGNLIRITFMLSGVLRTMVSVDRVAEFLRDTELLDSFEEQAKGNVSAGHPEEHNGHIGFRNVMFSWSNEKADGSLTPSKRTFRLRIEDELIFKSGALNLIIGPTGSGKTSILMALLGEMHCIPSGPECWVNLPRDGGIAYAAQESWVQNETIKENILFGEPLDEDRYKNVIHQCGLARDLSLFDAGDATEVGEKGITISGGQKARITLARAVYSSAAILLLDDMSVLAALDVHTARWIVDKCFKGDLLRGRTILLVTHNIALANPIAEFTVLLGADGRILSQGSVSDALAKDAHLKEELMHEEELLELDSDLDNADERAPSDSKDGKLVVAEETAVGHVSYAAFKLLLGTMGGQWPVLFWIVLLGETLATDGLDAIRLWWLGWWARQYDLREPSEVSVAYYLTVYSVLTLLFVALFIFGALVFTFGSIRSSKSIHRALTTSLLGSTFRWLDMTPTSRVITRCTQDMQAVDGSVANNLKNVVEQTSSMLSRLGAVVFFAPVFLLPEVVITWAGFAVGQVYMKAQLAVKREMSNAKSPVLGIFGGAMTGLTSIRAYGAQDAFKKETLKRIDRYTRVARTYWNLNRWIAMRISVLGALFATSLAVYLVYGRTSITPSNVGFLLTMAVEFTDMILWWVRMLNQFEVSGNSLERIQDYVTIEQEPKPHAGGSPPAYWPASGDLRVENLSARYSPDGPLVLRDISFRITSGQRIGVVGRTGSGKSSLTLALLRCIYTDGTVYYDGIPTHVLNLDAVRSNITFIPQVPELLSGTLRQNLDMFDEHNDATLNDALRSAGLFSLQSKTDENQLTLDSPIASGGGNLSVGQRQILALARAMVRQNKLLILDEATSAIDYETDAIIQESLRTALKNDVTVITVAHRLPSVMGADKIMVLDAGRMVEFDTPQELLKREGSLLRALVDESADKETLYAMAEGKPNYV